MSLYNFLRYISLFIKSQIVGCYTAVTRPLRPQTLTRSGKSRKLQIVQKGCNTWFMEGFSFWKKCTNIIIGRIECTLSKKKLEKKSQLIVFLGNELFSFEFLFFFKWQQQGFLGELVVSPRKKFHSVWNSHLLQVITLLVDFEHFEGEKYYLKSLWSCFSCRVVELLTYLPPLCKSCFPQYRMIH